MKLGGRIAVYFVLCALWAGFLFGAAALRYDAEARRAYQLNVDYNREVLRHNQKMAALNTEYRGMLAQERLYKACMKRHPGLGPEIVDLCEASAKLEVAAARLKAAQP
jgi:hypothetical protein